MKKRYPRWVPNWEPILALWIIPPAHVTTLILHDHPTLATAAQIPYCCFYGIGQQLIPPLAWELPHAAGAALKKTKKKKNAQRKSKGRRAASRSVLDAS